MDMAILEYGGKLVLIFLIFYLALPALALVSAPVVSIVALFVRTPDNRD